MDLKLTGCDVWMAACLGIETRLSLVTTVMNLPVPERRGIS
jgi:hypothetical protein